MLDGDNANVELDASFDLDGAHFADGGVPPFGHDAGEGGTSIDGCAPVAIKVGCGGFNNDCSTCKFDIEWKCGDLTLRVGGACDPADSSSSMAGFYDGVCDENGKQTSSFDIPTTTCDCKDASALLTILQSQCVHQ